MVSGRNDLQSNKNFECIVDAPLSSSKSSNHDNTEGKPTGKQTQDSNLLHSLHNQKCKKFKTK